MTTKFDPSLYAHAPLITLKTGRALADALLALLPKDAKLVPASLNKAVQRLRAAVTAAQAALVARQREDGVLSEEDSREFDHEVDNEWKAIFYRLYGWSLMTPSKHPEAARAKALLQKFFPNEDLLWLNSPYNVQSVSMETRLALCAADKLEKEVDALTGSRAFLAAVKDAQPQYDAMVRARLQKDNNSQDDLREHVRALGETIVDYAVKVCATVDKDEPDTITNALALLRPIDNHRDQVAKERAAQAAAEEKLAQKAAAEKATADKATADKAAAGAEPAAKK